MLIPDVPQRVLLVGEIDKFPISDILRYHEKYKEAHTAIMSESFILRVEFENLLKYYEKIKKSSTDSGDDLFDD